MAVRPGRVRVDGKFLARGAERFLIKGVTYGTFAPDAQGVQFAAAPQVERDLAAMARAGINTVRVYTPPPVSLLDAAGALGLQVMVGLPWAQHIAFLDDAGALVEAREAVLAGVRSVAAHPAVALCALGNEIPPSVVRWHGAARIESFLASLYDAAKALAPDTLFTYVNFPPTEFLDVSCFDVIAFNVYLHRDRELRAYLARLQQVAGLKPLLLAEAGADSGGEGLDGQARITAAHVRAAFEEGACGAVAFAWTDEWWRGGTAITDWHFGLVDRARQPKPALAAVSSGVRRRALQPRGAAHLATRVGGGLRLQRGRHDWRMPRVARPPDLSARRDDPRQRRIEGRDGRHRPDVCGRAGGRHPEWRPERRAQPRPPSRHG